MSIGVNEIDFGVPKFSFGGPELSVGVELKAEIDLGNGWDECLG